MYKYFLTLRYMLSKFLPHLSSLGVALCVFLSLTVVSLFSGFLDKLETAARGLFGKIVIDAPGARGIAEYDEFIEYLMAEKTGVSEVAAAEPFIIGYGMLRLKVDPNFRQHVQIAGIRLPGREAVSNFADGLLVQPGAKSLTFNPSARQTIASIQAAQSEMVGVLLEEIPKFASALSAEEKARLVKSPYLTTSLLSEKKITLTVIQQQFLDRYLDALHLQLAAMSRIRLQEQNAPRVKAAQAALAKAEASGASETELEELREELDEMQMRLEVIPDEFSVIPGAWVPGLSMRSPTGGTIRNIVPGHRMTLYVIPIGRGASRTDIAPEMRLFKVTDSSESGVYSIDKLLVYIPFKTMQDLNHMNADPPTGTLARCSQIHLRVKGDGSEVALQAAAQNVRKCLAEFLKTHPRMTLGAFPPTVETWRERQSEILQPLQQQRMLAIFALILISFVAVVLIFAILYMMTVQKTREIGLLKALGASNRGVAGLFFIFGSTIGVVGSALGVTMAYFVVTNINAIQKGLGLQVFTRKTHLFSEIPNTLDWNAAIWVVAGAILAGLLGALIPAIRAAWKQPVAALRYE